MPSLQVLFISQFLKLNQELFITYPSQVSFSILVKYTSAKVVRFTLTLSWYEVNFGLMMTLLVRVSLWLVNIQVLHWVLFAVCANRVIMYISWRHDAITIYFSILKAKNVEFWGSLTKKLYSISPVNYKQTVLIMIAIFYLLLL